MKIPATLFKTPKARGEWAELCFMTKAASMGLRVLKPFGDSSCYDVGVECDDKILRVQVKSTTYHRPDTRFYALALHRAKNQAYTKGTVDFFAAYVVPADVWYILPFDGAEGKITLHFNPEGKWEKLRKYREAWDLLRGQNPRP